MCPLEHTPTAMHKSIVHTELHGFRGVARCRPRVTQPPIHYNIFRVVRTLAIEHNCVGLRWPRFQKTDIHSIVVLEFAMWSSAREKIPSDPVAGRVRGMVAGQGSYKQKTLSVTRNMVVKEGWSLVRVVVRQGFYCS